jgi:ubiquinol-cytochrome c reductase cytochrome c subunit
VVRRLLAFAPAGLGGVLAVLAVAGVAAMARGPAGAQEQTPPTSATPADPPVLYMRDCAYCHAPDGTGTNRGTSLVGVGAASADFMLSTGRMPVDNPDEPLRRRKPRYSRAEIDRLVDFVASLGPGPAVPRLEPDKADRAQGGELYVQNCAACHGFAGVGGALSYGAEASGLHHSSPTEVAESMRIGPGTMPAFGPDSFDEQDLNDIASYVEYLRRPEDRGGSGLWHLGPFPEGMVAWLIGIGALLLVVRRLGARE